MLINDRCSQLRAFEFVKFFHFFYFHFPPDFDKELEAHFPISRSPKKSLQHLLSLTIRGVCPYPPLLQRNMLYHAFPSFFLKSSQRKGVSGFKLTDFNLCMKQTLKLTAMPNSIWHFTRQCFECFHCNAGVKNQNQNVIGVKIKL